ncbi:MAG TPA: ATP-binding protein [Burkholderiales bacterium]|nr:ATP-binding protein [Burkholderiales bacterium]
MSAAEVRELSALLERVDAFLDKLERWLPLPPGEPDWDSSIAFRWRKRNASGYIQPVSHPHRIRLKDLLGIERQKHLIDQNTRQFVQGYPANNVLLTGARGTGKSSLAKAVLNKYAAKGLRLIEVDKHDLIDMPDIVEQIYRRPERFLLFCDDLSFESDEPGYKALKAVLDGSIATTSENVLIYATSNRRHLMPEYMQENLMTRVVGEEVHPSEAVEEKISFSERFGLWLSFYPFNQDDYLRIVEHWLGYLNVRNPSSSEIREGALQWALLRGSRSGRVAWQFACDWAGRHGINQNEAYFRGAQSTAVKRG